MFFKRTFFVQIVVCAGDCMDKIVFAFLKLDISADVYNKRLAFHYTKSDNVPALVLIDEKGNTIDKALTEINSENIAEFMAFIKTKTKY